MEEKSKKDVRLYTKALDRYGWDSQLDMALEECGEFISAINKYRRKRVGKEAVITEIADVMIMMEQMALLFGWGEVATERKRKLERLEKILVEDTTSA